MRKIAFFLILILFLSPVITWGEGLPISPLPFPIPAPQQPEAPAGPSAVQPSNSNPTLEAPTSPLEKMGPMQPIEQQMGPNPQPSASPSPQPSPAATPGAEASPAVPEKTEAKPEEEKQPPLIIRVIQIIGNQQVKSEDIYKVINLKIGEELTPDKLNSNLQAIYEMGYFTDVKAATEMMPDGIKVVFKLLENPKIEKIQITGNQIVTTDKIAGLMKTKQGDILNSKTIYEDIREIDRYYNEDLGLLLSPSHVMELNWDNQGILSLKIKEGMVVNGIEIIGNTVIKTAEIQKLLKSKVGQYLNQKTLKDDTSAIAKLYDDRDYILDTIHPTIDREKGIVTLNIIEAVCEEIKIEGNTKTKSYVIERNLRVKVGEVLKRKKLRRDIERLHNLGYFENVEINPEPGSGPGKVVIRVKVKEAKTGLFTLGLGYSGGGTGAQRSGLIGAISFSENNFRGRGQNTSFQWQRGANIDALSVGFFDPSINTRLDSFGINLYRNRMIALRQPVQTSPGQYTYAYYDDNRTGGNVTFGRQWIDDLKSYFTYRLENLDIQRNPQSTIDPVGMAEGKLSSFSLNNLYDTRDDVFFPGRGAYVNAVVQLAGGALGGNFNYSKLQLEGRYYIPLKKQKVIALRAWGGILSGGDAPVSEYFYVGGTDSLRGYQDNLFYGTRMLLFNGELRFPIGRIESIKGAIFGDAGNAWQPGGRTKLYTDAGAGIRLLLPSMGLGVVRLDYAFGENGGRFFLGIGQTF